jgi:hypothetical protein
MDYEDIEVRRRCQADEHFFRFWVHQKLGGKLGKTRKNAATFLFFALITNVKLTNIERL